jgi:isopentenyl-diphosphate Delta-isomerase
MTDLVILVNESDTPVGTREKQHAHVAGELHRAFSVFIFDSRGRMLLQQRAFTKYHSGGLWSNSCCSHPRPGESTADAARRRLQEELGFTCPLHVAFSFLYRADVGGGLIEHEYDHVFIGRHDGDTDADPGEVAACRWAYPAAVQQEMEAEPDSFTYWFRVAFEELRVRGYLEPGNIATLLQDQPHVHQQPESRDG